MCSEPRCQNSGHCSVILAAAANLLMTNIFVTKSSITNTVIFIVICHHVHIQGPTCGTDSACRVLRTPVLQLCLNSSEVRKLVFRYQVTQ